MTWLFAFLAILVIAGVFLAIVGLLGDLPPAEPDLRPERIDGDVEFDVVVRGYRMDEVDVELARLHAEIERLRGASRVDPARGDSSRPADPA